MCWLVAGNETVLEAGLEGRGSLPGRPRPAVPPGHHSRRPSSGPAKHLPAPQGCGEEGLQQERTLLPSGPTWRAVGRPAKAACPPTQPLSPSTSLPSTRTGLASHPSSPMRGPAGKGVIRSCPPLHLFPLPLPANLIPYPGLRSPDGKFPTRATRPSSNLVLTSKSPLPQCRGSVHK